MSIAALAALPATAADIEATLRVDEVTVYPRTAAVTRRGDVNLPAGEHRLIVRGLPDPVDPGSLRVSAGSRAVRLGGVELERIVATNFVNDAESTLQAKLLALEDQRAAVQDEIPTAETQLKLIDSVAGSPADRGDKSASSSLDLPATLEAMGSGAAEARARIRTAKITMRELDNQITATKAELDKVRTAKKEQHGSAGHRRREHGSHDADQRRVPRERRRLGVVVRRTPRYAGENARVRAPGIDQPGLRRRLAEFRGHGHDGEARG